MLLLLVRSANYQNLESQILGLGQSHKIQYWKLKVTFTHSFHEITLEIKGQT